MACSSDDRAVGETTSKVEIENIDAVSFTEAFPELTSKISHKNIQKVKSTGSNSKRKPIEGVTFPIIDKDAVVGRYFGIDDNSFNIYVDFRDFKNKIVIYDVNGVESPQVFKMAFDISTNTYNPVLGNQRKSTWRYWLCSGACTAASVAIASVDGPAPVMDVLAVAYGVDCVADCADDHL